MALLTCSFSLASIFLRGDCEGARDNEFAILSTATGSRWILEEGLPSGVRQGMCSLCPLFWKAAYFAITSSHALPFMPEWALTH